MELASFYNNVLQVIWILNNLRENCLEIFTKKKDARKREEKDKVVSGFPIIFFVFVCLFLFFSFFFLRWYMTFLSFKNIPRQPISNLTGQQDSLLFLSDSYVTSTANKPMKLQPKGVS